MSQCSSIFNLLGDYQWHSSIEIAQRAYCLPDGIAMIARVASRIHDLKKLGHNIERRMVKVNGVRCAEYRLIPAGQLELIA